jgi:hypothetical protein
MKNLLMSAAMFIALSSPVLAQETPCGDREKLFSALNDEFGQKLTYQMDRSIPLLGNLTGFQVNGVVELTVNPVSGTWMLFLTRPSGITCLLFGGENARQVDSEPKPDKPKVNPEWPKN